MAARVEQLVTSGTFSLDGGTWDVDNNVWIVGDDSEAIVVDAAHDADAIVAALGGRALRAVVCTHAHDDHVNAAPALAAATGAPVLLHPDDLPRTYGPYHPLAGELGEEGPHVRRFGVGHRRAERVQQGLLAV
ncbi:MBL fold metallo-hydrolase, partial [Streptomyces fradiae]|uniref:MBL fold metallo-hydrolase n=1 Tax=Streptomyces fradiae TaxID=1906 RepID=UPI00344840C7